jgi:hypothetical protein
MIKAADALWDACRGHDPTVVAATTQRSRSLAPTSRKKDNERNGNARSKGALIPASISSLFTTLTTACENIKIFMATKPTNAFSLAPGHKKLSAAANLAHTTATAMHFPANAGLLFSLTS